ncbi:acyltransferase [Mesorhizobium sp. M0130]|uniref:acyltransferase family protein n=1 Tax=Mesorhizobium sp. M0130 TaxID=2956887 RepID=UPI003336B6E4
MAQIAIVQSSRVAYLDGLRGVAALSVVFAHLAAGYFPALYFVDGPDDAPAWMGYFASTPLFVLISGTFAVFIFLVLSGFVLSAVVADGRQSLPVLIPTRFLRLAVPASVSALVAYVLYVAGWMRPEEIASITHHDWAGKYYSGITTATAAFETAGGYFITGKSKLDPVLWTMRVELIGSYLIYFLFAFGRTALIRAASVVALGLISLFAGGATLFVLCFCVGSMFFDHWRTILRIPAWTGWAALIVGLLLGGYPEALAGTTYEPVGSAFEAMFGSFGGPMIARTIGAALIVLAVLRLTTLQNLLQTPPIKFLGAISFPLYLLHFPLLFSVFAAMFVHYSATGSGLLLAAYLVAFFAILFAAAWLLERFVDQPLLAGLRSLKSALRTRFAHA